MVKWGMIADTGSTSFDDLLRRAAWRAPDDPFVWWSDRDRTITYAEADALADRAAGGLSALGVRQGDRVGLLAHNGIDYVAAMLGAWRLGAISAHISVLVAAELAQYVNDCTPKVLVYTHDLFDAVERDRSSMSSIAHYLCMDGPQEGAQAWGDVLASAGPVPSHRPDGNDPGHLSYTSGSTGKPKGAVLRHGPTVRAARAIAERLELTRHDVSLAPTSLASSYHLVVNLLPGMYTGMTVGLRSKWDATAVLDTIEARGVTYLPANPFLLAELLDVCRQQERRPSTLRMVVTGGGPVPPELKQAFSTELSVPFCESYGQSELGGFVALGSPSRPPATDHASFLAVGRVLPDREVMIMGADGCEVATATAGEIVVRGAVMWGYWGLPERTAEVVEGGWLHTGDTGTMDADANVTVLGRWSERIEYDGDVLFPRPYEEALLSHPNVDRAAVIATADALHGWVPTAVVELSDPTGPSAELVLAWYRSQPNADQRLATVQAIDVMPMTPTGKLDKVTLRTFVR